MKKIFISLFGLIALLTFLPVTPALAQRSAPSFAVKWSDGQFNVYPSSVNDATLAATVTSLGNDEWSLNFNPKQKSATQVWFPYEVGAEALGSNAADDIIYYPLLTGFAYQNTLAQAGEWLTDNHRRVLEPCYPGNCFSPTVILADAASARLVAATNWPPKYVTPLWSRSRLALRYDESVPVGQTKSYRAIVKRVSVDPNRGEKSWQVAADSYKTWLKSSMTTAGLYPLAYPAWLENAEGFLHVGLSEVENFDLAAVESKWQRWKNYFPWLQFWGQMSAYSGPINESSRPGTGCCLMQTTVNNRYLPGLKELAARVKAGGGQVGYYSRPSIDAGGNVLPLDQAGNLSWLTNWQARNETEYGANAFYIDVLSAVPAGDPLTIAQLFKGTLRPATFVEWPVDIYPTSYLMGGSIWGGLGRQGGPGTTPLTSSEAAYPNFGRYVLDDRIFFSGYSNGDFYLWGSDRTGPGVYSFFDAWRDWNRSCLERPTVGRVCEPYWTERQTFLLGAKFDVESPANDPKQPEVMNPALRAAIEQRRSNNWWARRPIYLDTKGLSNVSGANDIRHFLDNAGQHWLAIDNWREAASASFNFYGEARTISIPNDPATGRPWRLLLVTTAPPTNPPTVIAATNPSPVVVPPTTSAPTSPSPATGSTNTPGSQTGPTPPINPVDLAKLRELLLSIIKLLQRLIELLTQVRSQN